MGNKKFRLNSAPRQNDSALDTKVVCTHPESKVNRIPYIGCCTGKIAQDNSLYWINFVNEDPLTAPCLGISIIQW